MDTGLHHNTALHSPGEQSENLLLLITRRLFEALFLFTFSLCSLWLRKEQIVVYFTYIEYTGK